MCSETTGMVGNKVLQSHFVCAPVETSGLHTDTAGFSGWEWARTWLRLVEQRSPGAVLAHSAHQSHADVWGGALEMWQE